MLTISPFPLFSRVLALQLCFPGQSSCQGEPFPATSMMLSLRLPYSRSQRGHSSGSLSLPQHRLFQIPRVNLWLSFSRPVLVFLMLTILTDDAIFVEVPLLVRRCSQWLLSYLGP